MLYCSSCMLLCDGPECPNCRAKDLREPQENDPVYLFTREALWAGGIEELLMDSGIPCMKRGVRGAGMNIRLGFASESYEFFVPYGASNKAKELLEELPE